GRLDHLVATADEIEIAVRVAHHGVARPHRELADLDLRRLARRGFESGGRLHWVVPVAQAHVGAAVHELAGLARIARRTVWTHDENLGIRYRLAHRSGTDVDLARIEIRRPERLREPVHQVHRGGLELLAELRERCRGHRAARVRDVAQSLGDG